MGKCYQNPSARTGICQEMLSCKIYLLLATDLRALLPFSSWEKHYSAAYAVQRLFLPSTDFWKVCFGIVFLPHFSFPNTWKCDGEFPIIPTSPHIYQQFLDIEIPKSKRSGHCWRHGLHQWTFKCFFFSLFTLERIFTSSWWIWCQRLNKMKNSALESCENFL